MTDKFTDIIKNKKTIYITVKNADYIRTLQFGRLLKEYASAWFVVSSEKSNPLTRACDVKKKLKDVDLTSYDVVIVGFLPQLIWKYIKRKLKFKSNNRAESSSNDNPAPSLNNKPVLVADFFLSLYDTIVLDRKYIGTSNPIAKCLRHMDRRVLKTADLVLTDTRADADFFAKEFSVTSQMVPLYLEADRSIYKPNIGNDDYFARKEREYLKDEKSFSVLYFGTGLPLQGIDIVIKAYLLLAEKYRDYDMHLTFIGGCDESLKTKAEGFSFIEMISWLPQDKLSERISSADLCLAGHFSDDEGKANRTIPGKAFIYEAMNKKMILGDSIANHEVFKEDEYHHFVKRGDERALAAAIEEFLDN